MLTASDSRLRALLGSAVLLVSCAVIAQAQSNPATPKTKRNPRIVRPLVLTQTRYQLRAGEARKIDSPGDTVDFVRNAKSRSIRIGGQEAKGFVVGPSVKGDEVLVAASLTMKPGEYALTVSVVSEAGEERQASLAVTVKALTPVPSTTTKPPVVLLNGWRIGLTSSCPVSSDSSVTFGSLAQYLESDGVPSVYFFDNCVECPSCKIEDLGNTLGQFLNLIHYDTGAPVPQIDLVTHSMGGLIVRGYLAGLQADGSLLPPPDTRIRKLVLIAEPNFGSFIALNIGTQTAEMIPGSPLLWELATWNQWGDDLRGVDALAIIGNAGSWGGLTNASDGVVSLTSGSIGFARDQSRTRILPYCHITPGFPVDLFMKCSTPPGIPGIALIDSPAHPTWDIIHSFLADTSDWTTIGTTPNTDPYLSRYGGVYFAVENTTGQYLSDLSQVTFGGTQLVNGASPSVFYDEFLPAGTGTFQFDSQSLGQYTATGTVSPGHYVVARSKFAPLILSVGPLFPKIAGRIVESGATVMVNGSGFGQACSSCQVLAVPAGSSLGYPLQISSWGDQAITASLPGTYNGFVRLIVQTTSGQDSINIMAAPAPAIAVTNQSLQFTYTIGGTVPVGQSIQVTNSGGGTLSWTAAWTVPWLTVTPASGTAPSTLTVSVAPTGLTAGMYTATVQLSVAGASNSSVAVGVTLTVTPAGASQPPTLMPNGVRSVANGAVPNPSGSLIYAQGTNLASVTPKPLIATSIPLPTHLRDNLDDVSATVNGTPAPMYYALPNYVAFQLPWETNLSSGSGTLVVTRNGLASAPLQFPVGKFSPGIFTTAGSGVGLAWAIYALPSKIDPKGTVAQPVGSVPGQVGVPATVGDLLYIYAGGLGPVGPKTMSDGHAPCPLPPSACPAGYNASDYSTTTKPVVMVGGVQATVTFSGLHPVYPGLYLVYFNQGSVGGAKGKWCQSSCRLVA